MAWFAAQRAVDAGGRWLRGLLQAIETLESMPTRCALAAESHQSGREIRELHFGKRRGTYRILFELQGKTVFVLYVRHAARDQVSPGEL